MSAAHKKGRSLLGIDINANEIRVVEMQGCWPTPELLRADRIPTPPGAVVGDEIVRPELVGKSLSVLLSTMGTHTRVGVMGIPSACVATRVLDIPHVPEEEILSVVQGEIVHQRILPNSNGEFDYLSLQTGDLRRQARPRLLLMAAEARYLMGPAAAAELAGIKLTALEPGLPAMYRAASPTTYGRSPCLCLMIGSSVSEVAIMDQGPIRLYRRIDMGATQFLGDLSLLSQVDTTGVEDEIASQEVKKEVRAPRGLADDPEDGTEEPEPSPSRPAFDASEASPARVLLVELQRSMDYYHREYPEAPSVNSIVVACGSQELTPFITWLSEALHIATVPASLASISTIDDPILRQELEGPNGFRYLRAAGLAMRGLDQLPSEIPQFDLLRHDPDEAKKPKARANLTLALAISILLMIGSTFNVLRLVNKASGTESELQHELGEAKRLRMYRGMPIAEVRRQKEIKEIIKEPAVSLPGLVDAVVACLPAEAAATDITLDSQGVMYIQGDAGADTVLVQLLDTLRQQPEFAKVSLEHLDRGSVSPSSHALIYQISLKPH